MAPLFTSINDLRVPELITNYVRALEYPQYQLDEYFPEKLVRTNFYQWDKTQLLQEPAVSYRPPDVESPLGARQGVQRGMVELPLLGKKKLMTEEMKLKRLALETGDYTDYLAQIEDDLTNLTQGVQGRWEIDRGTLLSTGALTVKGVDGFTVSVDYSVPGGNIVSAGTAWSDTANADIIANVRTWQTAYRAANRGLSPGLMLIGESVLTYILKNSALRSLMYYGAPNTGPSTLRVNDVQAELQANGLPPFRVITSQATDENGTTSTVFPQNKVIFLPPTGTPVGYTAKGVTGSALDMVDKRAIRLQEAPGIVGLTWEESDPARRFNMVDACGMPVLSNPNLLFIATVA